MWRRLKNAKLCPAEHVAIPASMQIYFYFVYVNLFSKIGYGFGNGESYVRMHL